MRALARFGIASFLLCSCSGPFAVFPGGALDGPVEPTPQSFAFAQDAGTVQLETRPEDPYSVNIACAVVGDALYVMSGFSVLNIGLPGNVLLAFDIPR